MLEPHRTMQRPGQGIVRPNGAATQHSEYPKHMVHPGYQPGKVGAEVKSPHGFSYHISGEAIRFPPVLAMDEDQEAYHASQGYVSIGKSDPGAFARAVAAAVPQPEVHVPDPYPKWIAVLGRSVDSAEDEAEALGLTNEGAPRGMSTSSEVPSAVPALGAEVNTLMVPAPSQDARVAALEHKVDAIVGSLDKLSAMLAQVISGQAPAAPQEPKPAKVAPADRSPESIARGEKIRAGIAKRKAEAAAAAQNGAATTEDAADEAELPVAADPANQID